MTKMHWYNPTTRTPEHARAPTNDEQALEMLGGHPNSNEFIVEYEGLRALHGVVEALRFTGETFRMVHQEERPSP